jgi:Mg2+-importing ATPase
LLYLLKADAKLFQTGWFVELVISAALIVLVMRTYLPFFKSLPGRSMTTLLVVVAVLVLPLTSLNAIFGFVPLPIAFYGWMFLIVILYIISAEITKRLFYRKWADKF